MFTARTLAWAGGVATVLGIVLLFVMAASRGWVTPPMRVGLGVAVSIVLLAAALEFDRRSWRADAILAAAGAGVAGLYASLWAATWLYHLLSGAAASPLAALIAAAAVAVAIRIRQEPLAVFGVSCAMVAPVLVSLEVTAAGLLFAAAMMAAVLPLYAYLRWSWLVMAASVIGFAEALALLDVSAIHPGFGPAVVAVAAVAALLAATALLVELLPAGGRRLTWLGGQIVSAAFTLSMADAFLFAGSRTVGGHSLAGLTLIGVALVWALLACVPAIVRRPHADLADLLAAFALAAAATATGLLAGGPALVCAWAAESAALVGLAERVARRSGVRRRRLTASAGIYLGLAAIAASIQVQPTPEHLPHIGAGSWQGSVALAAVAVAGIVFCFGLRWLERPERDAAWAVPALAIGYLPAWALPAEWAVAAYAGLAAALFLYRRSPAMVAWLGDDAAAVIAAGWWLAGAGVALTLTAPAGELARAGWDGLGARNGLADLAALGLSAAVLAWSVRRPRRPHVDLAALLPVTVAAYLVAEALAVPYAMWAWLGLAGLLAAVVHVPPVRRRVGPPALTLGSAGLLALGLVAAWAHDESLRALAAHGTTAGWESIAIASAAALLLATALLDERRRTLALVLPLLLSDSWRRCSSPASTRSWPSPRWRRSSRLPRSSGGGRSRAGSTARSSAGSASPARSRRRQSSCWATRRRGCCSTPRTPRPPAWRPPRPPRSRSSWPRSWRGPFPPRRCAASTRGRPSPTWRARRCCGRLPRRSWAPSSSASTAPWRRPCTTASSRGTWPCRWRG